MCRLGCDGHRGFPCSPCSVNTAGVVVSSTLVGYRAKINSGFVSPSRCGVGVALGQARSADPEQDEESASAGRLASPGRHDLHGDPRSFRSPWSTRQRRSPATGSSRGQNGSRSARRPSARCLRRLAERCAWRDRAIGAREGGPAEHRAPENPVRRSDEPAPLRWGAYCTAALQSAVSLRATSRRQS